jgi:circadian clock protein KaiB
MKSAVDPEANQPTSRLLLFVAGDSPNSVAALENLRLAIEDQGAEHFRLEIVDVFVSPDRALADQIIVTPTLLRVAPASSRRLIGDLSARSDLISFIKVQR